MNSKDLKNRWNGISTIDLLKNFVSSIDKISNENTFLYKKYNGRYDMRGIFIPSPTRVKKLKSYELLKGSVLVRRARFYSVDFSYSNLDYIEFEECEFENCLFEEVNFRNVRIRACNFEYVKFNNVKFNGSFLNSNIGKLTGSFVGVDFNHCDLEGCSFVMPIIKNTSFNNCKIKDVNFDGSRFMDVSFIGKIDSAWFNGFSQSLSHSFRNIFNRFNPKNYRNIMDGVDFSQSEIGDVTFANEIKLDKCIFPKGDGYLFIKNQRMVFQKLIDEVNNSWDNKEATLKQINEVILRKNERNQNEIFYNTQLSFYKKDLLIQKIFNRLKELNENFL